MAYFYKPPSDDTSVAFIARHYQLIILTHADEPYALALRQAGYAGPLLQYIAPNEAEGPGPYANHTAPCDRSYPTYQRTVADRVGVFCQAIHPHEDWFLHNRQGERLYTRYRSANGVWRTTYLMNPASRGWRQFLLRRMRQYRGVKLFDGFFLDNVDLSRAGLLLQPLDRGGLAEYPTEAGYRRAILAELAAIRQAFRPLPLWANLVHDPNQAGTWSAYLPWLDGVMVEDAGLGWR
ncbi:MAG: putative glycoside hydrolase, partial [Terriglobales bacterium]